MTDLQFDAPVVPEGPEAGASTPLHRAACRLQAVLPPGWAVDIVDPPLRSGRAGQAILRVRMPEN
ncbi:hypothetical protein NDR87_29085 [Nocardia sp. CDC159]|uniref:Uncharacterized protein n=1 Tax=Nocardia pulmonis TaxID=2951408 RepID=A0A9X2IYW0_9NOCA|nr:MULTISPECIES: hypothetical protein [Nocardia]MCM6777457.1 hypothetical protein [Nocardia pulmonis]MCM6790436.1 hypothetical protein [Nocardia sp. CDC159]